jgi:hypothetical protein
MRLATHTTTGGSIDASAVSPGMSIPLRMTMAGVSSPKSRRARTSTTIASLFAVIAVVSRRAGHETNRPGRPCSTGCGRPRRPAMRTRTRHSFAAGIAST